MNAFIKGADLSCLLETEERGGRFFDPDGREGDALSILADQGVNLIRLRLWNDPYSPAGEPYGGGTCDLERVCTLARRVKALGLKWQLVLHYSDFWADPGKQHPPKAWRGLAPRELERAVYDFTAETLRTLKSRGLAPDLVSVGNEVTNGLLWPDGKAPAWDRIAAYISAGIRAVRDTLPDAGTLIHLDNGGDAALSRNWFDRYEENRGEAFDWIGLSYYPFWSGSMAGLEENLRALALRFHKPLLITETAMGHTLADYADLENLDGKARRGSALTAALAETIPWPVSPEGQRRFLLDLAALIRRTPEKLGAGFVWWEPAWLPVPGSTWATEAALEYLGDPGPVGNEWANLTLFDHQGRALAALSCLKTL